MTSPSSPDLKLLYEIASLADDEIIAFLMTMPRIYAFLIGSQLLNSGLISGMPRNIVVLSLSLGAMPINLGLAATLDRSALSLLGHVTKEVAVGYLLGYLVGWIFWVVTAAGSLIDNQRGSNMASSTDPLQGEESTELGNLFAQAFLTYVFTTGAFLPILGLLYRSYVFWPAGKAMPMLPEAFPVHLLKMFDHATEAAVTLAAPLVAIMFAAEFALAMVARFAPQIQVFVLAMPVKSGLTMLVLNLYLATMLPFATRQLVHFETFTTGLFEMLKVNPAEPRR